MSAAAASSGGDGGEDEARKNDDRKRKEAERSRWRRAEKKAKDEADGKHIAELEKNLESNRASIQSLVAENQRLRNTALKNNAGQANQSLVAENQRLLAENTVLKNNKDQANQSLVAENQRLLAENTVLKNNTDQRLVAKNQRLLDENTVLRNLLQKKSTDQIIWDEVGDDQFEREKVLLDLEQECLEVYRRKVDSVNISRARRHPELAESEAEFTHLILSLGVDPWMGNASPSRYCVDNLVEPNGLTL
ncbi:hypothetical protein Vadar_008712 [Vaccinium darrowii]|uniref:Uncharacterized protein n=1 Tax=Vaccinium darrowii TaxID=229202 RepID=A0ACB7Y6C3_9ERIC|nr:hypothetical protein Vadar_008712 [Vaccinium darrowii]